MEIDNREPFCKSLLVKLASSLKIVIINSQPEVTIYTNGEDFMKTMW